MFDTTLLYAEEGTFENAYDVTFSTVDILRVPYSVIMARSRHILMKH